MEILPGEPSVVHHICFSFEKHKPETVYNRYEWVKVPRDSTGNPTPGNSGFAELPNMTTATREVGSNEVKYRPGAPSVKQNNDFCYIPGNSVDDYRPWNAGKLVPAGSDIVFSLHYTANGKAVTGPNQDRLYRGQDASGEEVRRTGSGRGHPGDCAHSSERPSAVLSSLQSELCHTTERPELSRAPDGCHIS